MQAVIEQIGPLFYPLVGLSVLATILIVERLLYFIRLVQLEKCPHLQAMRELLAANKGLPKDVRDELLSYSLGDLRQKMEYGIRFLRVIAVLSPMLGLLGTVLGMIEAFATIAVQTGPVAPATIADGLWHAMLTTAFGLSIALPSLLAAFIYARFAEKRLRAYQSLLNRESLAMEGVVFAGEGKAA